MMINEDVTLRVFLPLVFGLTKFRGQGSSKERFGQQPVKM